MSKQRKIEFEIGAILSISHEHLLTEMSNVYKILNFMVDDNLFTHQLPRARRFVMPFLLEQHPQLSEWDIYDPQINQTNWRSFLAKAQKMFGTHLEIEKVPSGVWTQKDPLQEAEEIAGKDRVMVISVDLSRTN